MRKMILLALIASFLLAVCIKEMATNVIRVDKIEYTSEKGDISVRPLDKLILKEDLDSLILEKEVVKVVIYTDKGNYIYGKN